MDISILILTHKESEYIDKSIQTALNQKFNGSFEVILCSDGDKTLKKYSDKYGIKFALSDKKNNITTCSYNVNKGVELSEGDFIKILAYDDWLPDNSIQILFDRIKETKSSVVCANSNEMRGDKETIVKSLNIDYTLDKLLEKNVIHGGTVLFSRKDFLEVGGYDNNLKFAEEYDFHLNLLFHNKKISYIDKTVHFYRRHANQKGSSLLTPEQKKEKQNYVNSVIKSKYYGDKIICGVATIKERVTNLKLTVNSIINQVDKLIVYQNGYKEVFDFLKNDKIEVISSLDTMVDMGDAGKFFKIGEYKNSYYLSIDDDLIYPKDYVSNITTHLKKFNNQVVVSHHGRKMNTDTKSYYLDILKAYRCLDTIEEITEVHFGGTGVMGLHTGFIKNLTFDYFKSPNMADVWIGKFAEENEIPIMVLPHKEKWITTSLDLKSKETIHKRYQFDHETQNKLIQNMSLKLRGGNKIKVIFLTCSYKRPEITKIFLNSLESTQKKISTYFEFTNIVVDSEKTNESIFKGSTFKYYNYTNNPVSNKWNYGLSLCKNIDFDYVFIIGSDDVVDEKLLFKYYELMNSGYDYFGIKDLYFLDYLTDELFYWDGYTLESGRLNETIGLGRCISKKIIEQLNFKIWDDGINKGLDKSMDRRIKQTPNLKFTSLLIKDKYFACDIKSKFNISSMYTYTNLIPVKNKPNFILTLPSKKKIDINGTSNLSIIIPTFNNVDFIQDCLSSVINSVKSLTCEILVGIDNCEKTVEFIKNKPFDSRIRFFYFQQNVGPYIVKNSLASISNANNLLFFDSDDIMLETFIEDTMSVLKNHKMYKPKYFDFRNQNEILNVDSLKSNKFGEGVFAIDKTTFLSFNGFEGWKCAADSDFMGRFYKRNIPFTHGQKISFLRRIHPNSLTNNPETNMSSKLRAHYFGLSRVKRPNEKCVEFKTDKFININTQSFISNVVITKNKPESEVKSSDILKKIRGTNPQQTNSNGVDYDKLNKILYSQGVYDPKKNTDKPKIVQNKPIDRNKLIEIKKGSNIDALKKNLPGKPDRRKDTQNIFSKKNSR